MKKMNFSDNCKIRDGWNFDVEGGTFEHDGYALISGYQAEIPGTFHPSDSPSVGGTLRITTETEITHPDDIFSFGWEEYEVDDNLTPHQYFAQMKDNVVVFYVGSCGRVDSKEYDGFVTQNPPREKPEYIIGVNTDTNKCLWIICPEHPEYNAVRVRHVPSFDFETGEEVSDYIKERYLGVIFAEDD